MCYHESMKHFERHCGLLVIVIIMTGFGVGCSVAPLQEANRNDNLNTDTSQNQNVIDTTDVEVPDDLVDLDPEVREQVEDWPRYANEEFGFSFRYPEEWGEITVKNQSGETDDFIQGTRIFFRFERDIRYIEDGYEVPDITITSQNFEFQGVADGGDFDFRDINFSLSEEELSEVMKRPRTAELIVEKTNIDDKPAVRLDEVSNGLDGEEDFFTDYLVPQFDPDKNWNMSFFAPNHLNNSLDKIIETVEFFSL